MAELSDLMTLLKVIQQEVGQTHDDVIRLQEQASASNRMQDTIEKRMDKHSERITAVEKLVWRGGGILAAMVVIAQFISSWLKMNGG